MVKVFFSLREERNSESGEDSDGKGCGGLAFTEDCSWSRDSVFT